ncbi:MAG: MBL fold metallo-hydrolase [Chloroflexi bacterium]|nr:MBL fold metallo-hydrolase [Chloroflexota bacterium]
MKELLPGIYRLPLPIADNPLGFVNTYLVRGNDGYLLIDSGWRSKEGLSSLETQLRELGLGFKDICQIVITHLHPDHFGLAGEVKALSNATIYLHELEKELIGEYLDIARYFRQLENWLHINGVPDCEFPPQPAATTEMEQMITPVMPDVVLHGGETITAGDFRFQALWTPGHSPGHICLYEPDRKILFSGDFILPEITPNISLDPQESGENPLDKYLASLAEIKALDVNLVLPAHQHLFTHLQQRIEELVRHHDQRNTEILQILKDEAKTAYELSTKMTWMAVSEEADWPHLSLWERLMAILEALAHLESMNVAGRVKKVMQNSTVYYQLA